MYMYMLSTGKVVHSMTAHMDAVTGLTVDPHGLYLLSGSECPNHRLRELGPMWRLLTVCVCVCV